MKAIQISMKTLRFPMPVFAGVLALLAVFVAALAAAEPYQPKLPMEIKVLVVKYFPVKGDRIDQTVTGDWGESLEETREKTTTQTDQILHALQEGSRYHGYKSRVAKPSLVYKVVKTIEFLEPLPTETGDHEVSRLRLGLHCGVRTAIHAGADLGATPRLDGPSTPAIGDENPRNRAENQACAAGSGVFQRAGGGVPARGRTPLSDARGDPRAGTEKGPEGQGTAVDQTPARRLV